MLLQLLDSEDYNVCEVSIIFYLEGNIWISKLTYIFSKTWTSQVTNCIVFLWVCLFVYDHKGGSVGKLWC